MRVKTIAPIATLVLAVVSVISFATPTFAFKPFLDRVRKHYTLDRSNGSCKLCHDPKTGEEAGRKNLNKYGLAIQKHPDLKPLLGKDENYKWTEKDLDIVEKIVVSLESDDSDGDGVTNKEELDLGTYPGDPKSVPEKLKLDKYRKDHPPAKK